MRYLYVKIELDFTSYVIISIMYITKISRIAASRLCRFMTLIPAKQIVRYTYTAQPGSNAFTSKHEQCLQVNSQTVTTKDGTVLTFAGKIYVCFAESVTTTQGAVELQRDIVRLTRAVMRACVSDMTIDEIFRDRKNLSDYVENSVQKVAKRRGVVVQCFEITDIASSEKEVTKSMYLHAIAESELCRSAPENDSVVVCSATDTEKD